MRPFQRRFRDSWSNVPWYSLARAPQQQGLDGGRFCKRSVERNHDPLAYSREGVQVTIGPLLVGRTGMLGCSTPFAFEALQLREVCDTLVVAQFVVDAPSLLLTPNIFMHCVCIGQEPQESHLRDAAERSLP